MSIEHDRERAEALIADGDLDEGMPLLLAVLDAEPLSFESLEALGVVASEDAAWQEELFGRIKRAVERAPAGALVKRALWFQLTHAAYYDRMDLVQSVLRTADVLVEEDPAMQAAIGALLWDLGERERGESMIVEANTRTGPGLGVAIFNWARISLDGGNGHFALDTWTTRLGTKGTAGIIRELGRAFHGIRNPDIDSIAQAKSAITRAEQSEDPLGPHIYSEVLFLKLRVALVEGKRGDAEWAGKQLGMPPHEHDPGVMIRARALVGPLHLIEG